MPKPYLWPSAGAGKIFYKEARRSWYYYQENTLIFYSNVVNCTPRVYVTVRTQLTLQAKFSQSSFIWLMTQTSSYRLQQCQHSA